MKKEKLWILFIIKGFQTIVFIFIVISTTFWPIFPPAFFRFLSNSGIYMELRTTSFIESMGITCSDSICHNWVQVLSIPVLLLVCSQDWTSNLQMIVSLEPLCYVSRISEFLIRQVVHEDIHHFSYKMRKGQSISQFIRIIGGAHGVMVIAIGNGHGNTSSIPGRDWLHFTQH